MTEIQASYTTTICTECGGSGYDTDTDYGTDEDSIVLPCLNCAGSGWEPSVDAKLGLTPKHEKILS